MTTPRTHEANEVLTVDSTLTSRGQTTIHGPIRRALGLQSSDKIRFSLRGDDIVVITRAEGGSEEDPMILAFLDFLERDTVHRTNRLRAMTAGRLERARELTDGVEVGLDAPLDPDDE